MKVAETFKQPIEAGYVDMVIGVNYGDEGKGNTVDRLLRSGTYSAVARFNGGANAGHQLFFDGNEIALHQVPSGVAHEGVINIIGNGSYLDPIELLKELDDVRRIGLHMTPSNFQISDTSHFVLPYHITLDKLREAGNGRQGSTAKGIAYVASEKYERSGARPELLEWDPEKLHRIVVDGVKRANMLITESKLSDEVLAAKRLFTVDPEVAYE